MTVVNISPKMLVQVVSPTSSEWQECLNTIPHDFYHLPGYLALEAIGHNATSEAIIIRAGEEVFFLAYLIRECHHSSDGTDDRGQIYDVISPYGYPGILVNQAGQNSIFIKKCLDVVYTHWQQRNICSAFIRLHPILNSYIDSSIFDRDTSVVSNSSTTKLSQRGNVVICDLTSELDDIWKQIRSSHRTKINKLKRSGFTAKMGSADKYLDVFIEIYLETMNRVNATTSYFFTRNYFEVLLQVLGEKSNICVVEVDGEIVAASLITEVCGIVQYHLGGTKTKFLAQSPTTIMFDYTIRWAKERNNNYLNLGGGLGSSQDSLYHFKSGFSDRIKSFMTIETIVDRDIYNRLTHARAETLGMTLLEIQNTSFFPSYRADRLE